VDRATCHFDRSERSERSGDISLALRSSSQFQHAYDLGPSSIGAAAQHMRGLSAPLTAFASVEMTLTAEVP